MPVESLSGRGRISRREAGRTSANCSERAMFFRRLARFSSKSRNCAGKNAAASSTWYGREDIETSAEILAGAAETRVVSLFIRLLDSATAAAGCQGVLKTRRMRVCRQSFPPNQLEQEGHIACPD